MKPTIVHVRDTYLKRTNTWLYSYLIHLSFHRPIVFARRTQDLDLFPIANLCTPPQKEDRPLWRLWNDLWYGMVAQAGVIPPWYDIGRRHLLELIKQESAVLLHAHFGQEGVRLLPVRAATGVPLVTTFYGYDMSWLPRRFPWLWKGHYRRLFSEGDLFLVEGSHMRRELVELGCPPNKVRIQHIGVDTGRFSFVPRSLSGRKVVLLACASFVEKKGLIYALEALRQVVPDYPHLEFRVIGGGPLESRLKAFAEQHRLESYVTWLGYQPHHVFVDELRRAHVFIQPSVTARGGDSEGGAPTTLLEAQATGIPVLATYHADIPEVVLDGQSGYLVPERDAEALAQRLRELIDHPGDWPKMGHAGRRHVEEHYDIRTEAGKLEAIYRDILAN